MGNWRYAIDDSVRQFRSFPIGFGNWDLLTLLDSRATPFSSPCQSIRKGIYAAATTASQTAPSVQGAP